MWEGDEFTAIIGADFADQRNPKASTYYNTCHKDWNTEETGDRELFDTTKLLESTAIISLSIPNPDTTLSNFEIFITSPSSFTQKRGILPDSVAMQYSGTVAESYHSFMEKQQINGSETVIGCMICNTAYTTSTLEQLTELVRQGGYASYADSIESLVQVIDRIQ